MRFTKLYNSIFNLLYFTGTILSILGFTSILSNPGTENDGLVNKLLLLIVILMLFFYVLLYGLKQSDLLKLILFFFPIVWALFFNSSFSYPIAFFYAMSVLILDSNIGMLKFLIIIKIILLSMVVFLWYIGVLSDVPIIKANGDVGHSLGFAHANSLGAVYLSIILDIVLWYYISNKKRVLILSILLFFTTYILYQVSFSRTAMFLAFLAVFCLLFKSKLVVMKVNRIICLVAFSAVMMSGVFLSYFYDETNELFLWLNQMFSNRLLYANSYFSYYGVSWSSQKILLLYNGENMIYNENFYASTMLSQGVLFGFIFYLYFIYCFISRNMMSAYIFLLIMISLVCSMFEGYGMNVFLNSVLLFNLYMSKKYT